MEIEIVLNKELANECKWIDDNKLSTHFDEYKTKCVLSFMKKTFWSFMYHTITKV